MPNPTTPEEAHAAMAEAGFPPWLIFQPSQEAIQMTQGVSQALQALAQLSEQPHVQAKALAQQINPILQTLAQMSVQFQQDLVQHDANVNGYFLQQLAEREPVVELAVAPELAEAITETVEGTLDLLSEIGTLHTDTLEALKDTEDDKLVALRKRFEEMAEAGYIDGTIDGLVEMAEEVEASTFVEPEDVPPLEPPTSTPSTPTEPTSDNYDESSLL